MRVRHLLVPALVAVVAASSAGVALAASDPYRAQQWNVDRIEAPLAWELSRGEGILVAIVDTGIDLTHPDLVDRIARRSDGSVLGRDYVDDDGDPSDENGHGTLVAGVVAATLDNGVGIAGIAPRARLMPIRVLDAEGAGTGEDVDAAIRWAVDNGAQVVNLSLESVGSAPNIQLPIGAPTSAVRYAWDRGVVVVAASGNDSARSDDYPADSPVVLVGATTRDDRRASFSDTGRSDALMAPGVDIISTWWCDPASCADEHTYGEADGTSFAAPHVSGAVAVLRAQGLTHQQAVQRLRETARDIGAPGRDEETGYGLIDLAAAAGARNPPSSPSPSPSPTARPSPSPSPTARPSPSSSATARPSPSSSPTARPGPSPSPTGAPPASPSGPPSPTDPVTVEPSVPAPSDGPPSPSDPPTATAPPTPLPGSPTPAAGGGGVAVDAPADRTTVPRGIASLLLIVTFGAHGVARRRW